MHARARALPRTGLAAVRFVATLQLHIKIMSKTLAHQLADYACALHFEDLSPAVIHEVKRRVIDSLGCALGAWSDEPCVIARKVASEFSARQGSTIIGTTHKAPPDWTAFANGCAIRYFDYNDTYLSKEPAHPSDNISAGLAIAESVGATGQDLITAIALAYEVQCRFCDAASIRARGWDHVTYGTFSTALACARLMNLDPKKTRHAVNIAGVAGAAMRQARVGELSHWKGVAFATAARHGVFSALLARAGMTGPGPIFEGQMGFEKQLGVSLGNVGEKFAVPFSKAENGPAAMILNTSIKHWPAEYHSQSAIEAALFLRNEISDPSTSLRTSLAQIKSMTIESHDASVDIIGSEPEKWRPATRETADHSLPYITAIALIDGEVTNKQFEPERFKDPEVWKFLKSVSVERNAKLSAMYPGAVANIVHIDLVNGRRLTKRVDYPLGHARNPLKDSEVEGKFFALVVPTISEKRARNIVDLVWKLDEAKNVDELMEAMRMTKLEGRSSKEAQMLK
jgi:2-methylcitrate dehydratase